MADEIDISEEIFCGDLADFCNGVFRCIGCPFFGGENDLF